MDETAKTLEYFREGYNCAQALFLAHRPAAIPAAEAARMMSGFGGGVAKTGGQCGAISALVALIGLAQGREQPDEMDKQAATYRAIQAALQEFEAEFGSTLCRDLLRMNIRDDGVRQKAREHICPRFLAYASRLALRYAEDAATLEEEKRGDEA